MSLARIRQTPTAAIAAAAAVVWLVSGAYMLHFGASWHLDLRGYREAGSALYHHGSPFTVDFTANHPGNTLFHCHQQDHMDNGFMMLFRYA